MKKLFSIILSAVILVTAASAGASALDTDTTTKHKYNLPQKPVIEFSSQYKYTLDGENVLSYSQAESALYKGEPLPIIEVSDDVRAEIQNAMVKERLVPSADVLSQLDVRAVLSDGSMLIYYDRKDVGWFANIVFKFMGDYLYWYSPHLLLYKDGVFCGFDEGYNSGIISEQTMEEIAALKKLPKYVGIDEEKIAGLYESSRGDFNYDLYMDIKDVTYLQRYLADQYEYSYRTEFFGDINGDGTTNVLDVTAMQTEIIG